MATNLNDEVGFTLLEVLIALMMTQMIMLLLIGGFLQTKTINQKIIDDSQLVRETSNTVAGDRQIEWHLFLNQLEYELQGTVNPYANKGVLEVQIINEKNNAVERVSYSQPISGETRRFLHRFKNNGNVRILSGVQVPEFSIDGNWLLLNFSFRNGEKYKGRIWVESWEEELERKDLL